MVHGCGGRVFAVVTGAIYLVTGDGDLFWLARDGVPMHARAILACFDSGNIRKGMHFSICAETLHIDKGVTVDCTAAHHWVPAVIPTRQVVQPAVALERARELRGQVGSTEMPSRARPIVQDIESACLKGAGRQVARLSQELIGLGPGLTPSGDDFVGGLLFALHYLRAVYPEMMRWDRGIVDRLLGYARTRTHLVSYTLLRDHAHGQGVEPLHGLIGSIIDRERAGGIAESARQLVRIGSTSGGELLAGALTAMLFLEHRGDSDDDGYQTSN
jgi:hypothetical protein